MKTAFPFRLNKLREKKKLLQSKMASKLGVSQATIARWENGKLEPTLSMLLKIAKYFKVSIDYLMGADIETQKTIFDIYMHKMMQASYALKYIDDLPFEKVMKRYFEIEMPAENEFVEAVIFHNKFDLEEWYQEFAKEYERSDGSNRLISFEEFCDLEFEGYKTWFLITEDEVEKMNKEFDSQKEKEKFWRKALKEKEYRVLLKISNELLHKILNREPDEKLIPTPYNQADKKELTKKLIKKLNAEDEEE